MNNELGSIEKDGIRLTIVQDEFNDSPRDWEPLGIMVCFHHRYNLGDKHNFEDPEAFGEQITEEENYILPLYLYDHSGLTISIKPFACPWDSGQIGWIYVPKRDIGGDKSAALQRLEEEVEAYDAYLRGEVYGFYLEKANTCSACQHIDYAYLDSCYGFLGNVGKLGMRDSIPEEYRGLFDELLEQI